MYLARPRTTICGFAVLVAVLPAAASAWMATRPAAPLRPVAARAPRAESRTFPSLVLPPLATEWDRQVGDACQRALGPTPGAVVAMDPHTGRVLAIVNPSLGLHQAFQPCSVFKIVVAIAGLSEGVITPETVIPCRGGCWMWPGHGPIDLRRALAVSCNPYFERVGERLGYPMVQRYAERLGLGELSGINLTGEAKGRLPERVDPRNVGHLSSHASGIRTTAVQLAVLISTTINGGIVYQPQIASAENFAPRERWRLPAGTVFKGLAEGFVSAVNEGSALGAFDPEIVVAGKTGSCSRVGWFASYAPAERPEVVVVVFLRWGNGHDASAVAGRIYQGIYKTAAATPGASRGR